MKAAPDIRDGFFILCNHEGHEAHKKFIFNELYLLR